MYLLLVNIPDERTVTINTHTQSHEESPASQAQKIRIILCDQNIPIYSNSKSSNWLVLQEMSLYIVRKDRGEIKKIKSHDLWLMSLSFSPAL